MAAKEKINLLDVIPCRSEHITVEREGETIVLSFPRFKYTWMSRFLFSNAFLFRRGCRRSFMCIWKNTERLYGN